MLRLLDRYWDVWTFFVVPFALLIIAASLGLMAPSALTIASLLILSALAIMTVGLVSTVVLQAYRLLSGRRRINETAVGQVRAMHWTMVLCHVEKPAEVGPLLEDARRCGEPPASETHPVLYLERGITTRKAREAARSHSLVERLSEVPPVFVVAMPADLPLELPDEPGRFRGSDVAVILGGSAVAFAVLAWFIPPAESAYCSGPSGCSGRPVTYGEALYWVFSRVLGGDPEALGVVSPWSRVIGLLLTFYGVVVLIGIIERVIQQQIDQNTASGPSLVRTFNQLHEQRVGLEEAQARLDQQPKKRLRLWERVRARARGSTKG